ncbi:gonadal somatic cell derived factor [Solea solea]|uniref:gonadal somatic cell derived factor n=1 Tax=Solea solea TaxID=90069 RepID=UPI00272B753A|nr:gonadal somatic cell derived factor [Solea solea]
MSFAVTVVVMLLGSSVAVAYVLQPSNEEPATPALTYPRCQGESLESIRKSLLKALNLQTEPRLPAGGLDTIREQWQRTFATMSQRAEHNSAPPVAAPTGANGAGLSCCSVTSEIFMKDLGWDNWVIHPSSLTMVQCAPCNPETKTLQCPSSFTNSHDATSQVPCCEPSSQEMVPVVYMDEYSAVVISSVQLTRSCGCGPENIQQPSKQ